ncbi:HTH-type transcriptional regulator LuxR [Vibrio stylophorae]|uniref:HTH-type transcriptional regulator LuxR n=1 Tax=Vibrio stylophorae TaxID=659351 RepID=A0ABN8DUA2_9VIBR|nr:TetR/AcrR family transcriptional regulator [Vibrio stylophorae]CAH0534380.1 HTH-type transcriptional regulator LuxR [Vibrio stylophorae]
MDTSTKRRRTRLSPEQRREQLLNTAMEVFALRGIGRAGHAEIAEIAQVSVATVFNYFPTREDLVDVVLAQAEREFALVLKRCFQSAETPLKQGVTALLDGLMVSVQQQVAWVRVWFEWSTSTRDEVWPKFLQGHNETNQFFIESYETAKRQGEIRTEALQADTFADYLHGICYVLFIRATVSRDEALIRRKTNEFLELIFN